MSKTWKLAAITLALFGTTQVTACGGSECGEGTVDQDGTCKVKSQVSCGDGTKLAEGKCVLESTPVTCADGTTLTEGVCQPNETCGEGTTADATGQCVPNFAEVECATGTTLSEGKCVPSQESCAPGTTLNGGVCTPDVICGDGTTARDGKCLTNDELLKLDADLQEMEENDPSFGGTAISITLPNASDSFSVAGNIATPADKDQDNIADQDLDFYTFQGTAGTFLNLKVLNKGAGSMGFVIQGPNGYLRIAPTNQESPERQVLLPYDGDYVVTVGPSRQLFNQSIGPDGGDDKNYIFVVENLGPFDISQAPVLDAAASQSATGKFIDLKDNVFKVQSAGGQLVQLSLPEIDVDALASIIILDANGQVVSESGVSTENGVAYVPAMDNGMVAVVDYVRLNGVRDSFTVQAKVPAAETIAQPLKGGQTVTFDNSVVVEAGESVFVQVDVELKDAMDVAINQGTVVLVNLPATMDQFSVRVIGPDNKVVEGFGGLAGFFARIGGKYTLELTNRDTLRPAEATAFSLQSYIPQDAGTFGKADAQKTLQMGTVPEGDFQFFLFETSEPMGMDFDVKQTTTPAAALVVAVLDTDLSIQGAYGGAAASYSYADVPFPEAKRRIGLLYSQAGSIFSPGSDAIGTEVTLKPDVLPPAEVEPNGSAATATPVLAEQTLLGKIVGGPKRDLDLYKPSQAINEPSLISATINVLGDTRSLTVELRDSDGLLYDAIDGTDGELAVGAIAQPGKDYFVHVYSADGFDDIDYTISLEVGTIDGATPETEANNTGATATAIQPQIMPSFSFGAAGTLAGRGDEDWFTLNLPAEGYVKFALEQLAGANAPHDGLKFEVFEEDMSGNVTPVADASLVKLQAGKKLIKVSGATATGYGNTYVVRGSLVSADDLGTVGLDTPISQTGTFGASGEQLFSFTLSQDMPMDDSQALVFWASAELQILDSNFTPIFTPSTTTGYGPIGAGYFSQTLTTGTYFARLTGVDGDEWQLITNIYNYTQETEAADPVLNINDSAIEAEDLGIISTTPVYRFGNVEELTDEVDYFQFTVPDVNNGDPVSVMVEHMQFGTSIYDLDLEVVDVNDDIIDINFDYEGWEVPQFVQRDLAPGTYWARSVFWDTSNGATGNYLIRVYHQ